MQPTAHPVPNRSKQLRGHKPRSKFQHKRPELEPAVGQLDISAPS